MAVEVRGNTEQQQIEVTLGTLTLTMTPEEALRVGREMTHAADVMLWEPR